MLFRGRPTLVQGKACLGPIAFVMEGPIPHPGVKLGWAFARTLKLALPRDAPNCGSLAISLYPFLFSLGYSAKGARFEQGQFSAEKPVPPGSALSRNQQLNASARRGWRFVDSHSQTIGIYIYAP
jgi:hypothetical protein